LQQTNDAVVSHGLRIFVTDVGMDKTLDGNHVAGHDTGVLQELLCLFVETAAPRDYRVRNGEEDDLDKLDTNNLDTLAN
jgi:hypothetical protein